MTAPYMDPRLAARPSLIQRIAGTLFPLPSGGLLSPQEQTAIQRQGLLQLGMGLLANSGQRPVGSPGASFGERLASAFQGVNFPQMAQQAMQNAASAKRDARLQSVAEKYPPKEGETTADTYARVGKIVSELAGVPGTEDVVGRLSNVLAQLRPQGENTPRLMEVRRGNKVDLVDPQSGQTVRTLDVTVDPNIQAGKDTDAAFRRANQLYGRFLQQTRDEKDIALNYNAVTAAGRDPSPAGDLSLIFAYMKMLDPGSVVREGEFATAANTGAVPERVRAQYNKVVSGERLTATQRADFLNQAKNRAMTVRRALSGVIREFGRRAKKYNIEPDDVAYDYFSELEMDAPTGERPTLDFK